MIGLYDADLFSAQKPIPNLEVMKLAAYYVQEKRQVCRLLTPYEKNLDIYDIVYCCSEFSNNIPRHFWDGARQIKCVGPALNGGKYVPFDDPAIDLKKPKTAIYKEFLRQRREASSVKEIEKFLTSAYYRMYAGDLELPSPKTYGIKPLYVYDTDVTVHRWKEIFKEMETREHAPSTVYFLHPIRCKDVDDLVYATKMRMNSKNKILIDFQDEDEDFFANYGETIKELLQTQRRLIYLPFDTVNCHSPKEEFEEMERKLSLLYHFWAHGIPLSLYYENDGIYCSDTYAKVFASICHWSESSVFRNGSTLPWSRRITEVSPDMKKMAREIIFTYPRAGELFNYSYRGLKEGREWIRT